MPELLTRIVYLAIPLAIAAFLGGVSSKVWVPLRTPGTVGIYFIIVGIQAHFEGQVPPVIGLLYGVLNLVGMILLAGDAGGRFKRDHSTEEI